MSQRERTDLALCRSILYEVLAIGFARPTAAGIGRLAGGDALAALRSAAEHVDAAPGAPAGPGAVTVGARVEALAGLSGRAASGRWLPELETVHARLFGHSVRGLVPPYETEYGSRDGFLQPHELADINGFLRAFDLTLKAGAGERVDHVSCECEFSSFLARKEAFAIEQRDGEMLRETVNAERLFLRDHLARFAPALSSRLERADAGGLYGALGGLLRALVAADCARFEVQLGPVTLELRPWTVDPTPATCGSAEGGGHPVVFAGWTAAGAAAAGSTAAGAAAADSTAAGAADDHER